MEAGGVGEGGRGIRGWGGVGVGVGEGEGGRGIRGEGVIVYRIQEEISDTNILSMNCIISHRLSLACIYTFLRSETPWHLKGTLFLLVFLRGIRSGRMLSMLSNVSPFFLKKWRWQRPIISPSSYQILNPRIAKRLSKD